MSIRRKKIKISSWAFDQDKLLGTIFFWNEDSSPSIIIDFCLLQFWEFLLNSKVLNIENEQFTDFILNLSLTDLIRNDIKQWYLQRLNLQLFEDMADFTESLIFKEGTEVISLY